MFNLIYKVPEFKISYKPKFSFKKRPKIISSQFAADIFFKHFDSDTIAYYESAKLMMLNRENRIIGIYSISEGSLSGTIMDIRKIFQALLLSNSHSYIVCHNHPSSQLKPSKSDIDISNKLKKIGKLMNINLLDHLIITPDHKYHSMEDNGDLNDYSELDLL